MNKRIEKILKYALEKTRSKSITADDALYTIFLCDWKSAITRNGRTLSNLSYSIKDGRLFSDEFIKEIKSTIKNKSTTGDTYEFIIENSDLKDSTINSAEKSYIDFVINFLENRHLTPEEASAYSYPLFSFQSDTESEIDLGKLAEDYIARVKPNIKTE